MTTLTTKARKKLPAPAFAGPDRSYPVPDRAHAANAKTRATQMVDAGKLAPSTAAKIKAKANKVLGGGENEAAKNARTAAFIRARNRQKRRNAMGFD